LEYDGAVAIRTQKENGKTSPAVAGLGVVLTAAVLVGAPAMAEVRLGGAADLNLARPSVDNSKIWEERPHEDEVVSQ
jgi:hypothetical protein